ncbi:MAG TPA: DUF5009 domain-containing protein [Thermoanaerobaculia bacterium]|nr:DUF5009 domain-containing protein [Thermoanaerobaculia bacterium]
MTVATVPRERLLSLDVFRGLTVAGMLLVNNPGTWSAIYEPLGHAKWHGWTPTDLVFPFFLFIVGVTTHLSLSGKPAAEASRKAVRRGLLIVLFGLLLSAFPFFWWGEIRGNPDPSLFDRVIWRLQHFRFPGVLQRIGVAYMAGALIAIHTTRKQRAAIIVAILIGYWMVMTLVPVPGTGTIGYFLLDQPDKTLAAWLDRALLGSERLWASTKTWDPEGPLSTIPAVATVLSGVFAGEWLTKKERPLVDRVAAMFAVGSLTMLAGLLWSWVFPINKNLWTSSYVLFTAGFAALVLGTCMWLIDVKNVRWWTPPFVAYGINPLIAFVGSGVMARITDSLVKIDVRGKSVSIHQAFYQAFLAPYFPPKFASLLYALLFVGVWLVILRALERRKIILKV